MDPLRESNLASDMMARRRRLNHRGLLDTAFAIWEMRHYVYSMEVIFLFSNVFDPIAALSSKNLTRLVRALAAAFPEVLPPSSHRVVNLTRNGHSREDDRDMKLWVPRHYAHGMRRMSIDVAACTEI